MVRKSRSKSDQTHEGRTMRNHNMSVKDLFSDCQLALCGTEKQTQRVITEDAPTDTQDTF